MDEFADLCKCLSACAEFSFVFSDPELIQVKHTASNALDFQLDITKLILLFDV
jgi:hypothetical protein